MITWAGGLPLTTVEPALAQLEGSDPDPARAAVPRPAGPQRRQTLASFVLGQTSRRGAWQPAGTFPVEPRRDRGAAGQPGHTDQRGRPARGDPGSHHVERLSCRGGQHRPAGARQRPDRDRGQRGRVAADRQPHRDRHLGAVRPDQRLTASRPRQPARNRMGQGR
jgi:hypothetical protein